ncbi:hypothetical protein CRG49_012395 [Neisseria sp. N95_16]|uniref:Uncharacterized protein n=1 Tax=Neisseria brasiliensis TaxID=2666100 RepID=A0A7X2KYP0_9NEIS|nr:MULTISPECIES: hypothetical protein [Neisseria]MRN37440.1 hypothetical protein [Neisseria brasiliensis]PJO08556.1 hypothetical protein CRG49_012395 [Neisseria sp. N95_16]
MAIFFIFIIFNFKTSFKSDYRFDTKEKLDNIQKEIGMILEKNAILSEHVGGRAGRRLIVSLDAKYINEEQIKENLNLKGFKEIAPDIFCRGEESIEIIVNQDDSFLYWLYPDNQSCQ